MDTLTNRMLIGHADVKIWKGYRLKFDHLIGKEIWYTKILDSSKQEIIGKLYQARENGLRYINSNNQEEMITKEVINQCKITIIEVWQKQ